MLLLAFEHGILIVVLITFIFAENFMTGYQMVFDREKMKLGWSHSKCKFTNLFWVICLGTYFSLTL